MRLDWLVLSNMFTPSRNFLTDRSKVVLLLWILFVICVLCLSLLYYLVSSLQPVGKGLTSYGSLVCDVLEFFFFPYGFLGLLWYLIVLITDLCLLPYFV